MKAANKNRHPAPQELVDLVEKFERNIQDFKNVKYNETSIRVEFVNPFFKALGWDVENKAGKTLAYRDVIHEDEVKVSGVTKAPDYSFRLGGSRKFFVETKKPAVNLKDDPAPAFQLRRYAYSARLPVSILTDFEEFIIYDCNVKPNQKDKATVGRIKYYTFREYIGKWEEISALFCREAVQAGSIDRFVKTTKGIKGTTQIDHDFLSDLDSWRLELAKNFALRNPKLTSPQLNYAVQMTIDRIIFLRMCEDRGIESYGQLLGLTNGAKIYPRLTELYRRADEKYNSGLFHFTRHKDDSSAPDELTPGLTLDDKVLKSIIKQQYYPDSPYEFSILPVEVLGNAYEQFLGKTIRLTGKHRAQIEEKPEVRKAGGVYYTPQYVVSYIVDQTVGRLLENKDVDSVSRIKILDPACGSGSFLLGAYQYLLDWHLNQYKNEMEETKKIPSIPPDKGKRKKKSDPAAIFQGQQGDWFLSTAEKKRILLNNIHGVDIDQQAVEVTKLSLLLKVLENENKDTLNRQLSLWRERALPDLTGNIKCGNSLIGPDIYNTGQMELWADTDRLRVNAFDWEKEFPAIMKTGGFDAVIGNPPYIGFHGFKEEKKYFNDKYVSASGKYDIYVLFIEKAIELIKDGSLLSYICPTGFMKRNHGKAIRGYLLKKCTIKEITDFEHQQIFKDARNYTGIIVLSKPRERNNKIHYKNELLQDGFNYPQHNLSDNIWVFRNPYLDSIITRIQENRDVIKLATITENISEGIVTGLNDLYLLDIKSIKSNKFNKEYFKPCLRGRNIRKFCIEEPSEFIFYPYDNKNRLINELDIKNKNPGYYRFLLDNKDKIESRGYFSKSSKKWYELWNQRKVENFENIKIVVPELSNRNRFAIDNSKFYYGDTVCGFYLKNSCSLNINYVLGLLNSSLIEWYYKKTTVPKANNFFIYKTMFLNNIPIRKIDFNSKEEKGLHNKVVDVVDKLQETLSNLTKVKTDHEKTIIQRQIDAADKAIDQLVYQLYGLTDKEIKIVEEAD